MATAILPLSLYRDIKITAATIDHKLSLPIARHKSNIENIDGPKLGRGVGGWAIQDRGRALGERTGLDFIRAPIFNNLILIKKVNGRRCTGTCLCSILGFVNHSALNQLCAVAEAQFVLP